MSKHLSKNYHLSAKGKIVTSEWRNWTPGLNLISTAIDQHQTPLDMVHRDIHMTISVVFLPQMNTRPNHEEIDKSKLRYTLQNNWPVLQNVKVKKNQIRLKNFFRLKKTRQLNVWHGLDPGARNIDITKVQFSWFWSL